MHNFTIKREINVAAKGEIFMGDLTVGGIEVAKSDDSKWVCYWSFPVIHPKVAVIYGADPLDALFNCIQFLIVLIEKHKKIGYEIWWLEKEDNAGLRPFSKDAS